ncbi:uncharacterized protein BX664DRAFT_276778 [Halteromyces radiatus]|uniref:uncharacterized protein n=1 Tax=Halteromyces radiatus TaxID=101107 RepID=UPI00221E7F01|nr:uncharacterized protein BX664DRAFT_276778 [Halteromyces radiatus]KAI8092490.1 hypothetical protein BX664DRAFT_276778 [Halteromyces radiatus]
MATQDKLDILLKWFKDNQVEYEQESIDIRIKDGSFGVYALKNLPSKKTVVKIPKENILSIRTTGIANILDDESIEGGCSLALAVLYEMYQGKDSPWYGYLQSLPVCEDLPIFWSDTEKSYFKGTEMEHAVENDLQDLKDDYEDIVKPLLVKYPDVFPTEHFTFEQFQKVTTLVASRAFEVDAYHENAMVPFADIFNHRSGNEHVHFETDFEVCDACGALEYCEHQYLQFLENDDNSENDQEMEGSEGEWSDDDDDDDGEEEEGPLKDLEQMELEGIDFWKEEDDDDDNKKDTCDMVLDRAAKKNEELFNTYGDHPSITLLNKYGFCYDNNPNDYISVSEDNVVDLCLAVTKEMLRSEHKTMDDEALDALAVDRTRPRWEFFLLNESILCPSAEDEEQDMNEDDYEEDDDEHGHGHDNNDNDDDHEHDQDGGCCGGDDERGHQQGKSYFANVEGLYEDTLTCLLHIMFVEQSQFDKFIKDTQHAVDYFEKMASGKKMADQWKMKKCVYQVCKALSEHRRQDYLDPQGKWISVQDDFETRKKTTNKREYYALTCRMNEKKIIEKSIDYYDTMIQQCKPPTGSSGTKRKSNAKKIRKTK